MKMARASDADLEAALAVSRILMDLEQGHMPDDDKDDGIEWFDRDNAKQCQRVLGKLLVAAAQGSVFRVTFGMAVVLDPRNELLDPAADTLEKHPKTLAALEAVARNHPGAAHTTSATEATKECEKGHRKGNGPSTVGDCLWCRCDGLEKIAPTEIFVVVDDLGQPSFSATWPEACQEHIRDALGEHDIAEASEWLVRRYMLAAPSAISDPQLMQGLVSPENGDADAIGRSEEPFAEQRMTRGEER